MVDILFKMKSLLEETVLIGGLSVVFPNGFEGCCPEFIRDDELDGRCINAGIGGGRTTEFCWEWGNKIFELEKLTLMVLECPNLNGDVKGEIWL